MSSQFGGAASQPQSLLNPSSVKGSSTIKVFIEQESVYHKVAVQAEGLTANQAICRAIDKFNEKKQFHLIRDPNQYELFAARKDGSKDSGLPALQTNQLILKTGIKRFHLVPMLKVESLYIQMETKDTISSIKSEINIGNAGKKQLVLPKEDTPNKQFNLCGLFCIPK